MDLIFAENIVETMTTNECKYCGAWCYDNSCDWCDTCGSCMCCDCKDVVADKTIQSWVQCKDCSIRIEQSEREAEVILQWRKSQPRTTTYAQRGQAITGPVLPT